MTKTFGITIYFKDGRVGTYSPGTVVGYDIMQQGLLFIQFKDIHTKGDTKLVVDTQKTWINLSEINHFDVTVETTFKGDMELAKYDKFKSRGIDMVHTAVSQTVVDPEKVAAEVEKDPHIRVLKQKAERLAKKKPN